MGVWAKLVLELGEGDKEDLFERIRMRIENRQ